MKNNHSILLLLSILIIGNPACSKKEKTDISGSYIPVKGTAYHIALVPAKQDASKRLVYATYQGHVISQNLEDGQLIFDYDAGSFPFSMKAMDINGNGETEVLVALASGELIALSARGELLWTFKSKMPLFAVDAGNIIAGGNPEIVTGGLDRKVYLLDHLGNVLSESSEMQRLVHRLAVGNLHDSDTDEILVIENRVTANLLS